MSDSLNRPPQEGESPASGADPGTQCGLHQQRLLREILSPLHHDRIRASIPSPQHPPVVTFPVKFEPTSIAAW